MRVLIADDERDICDAVCKLLAREGHTCVSAYDGEIALRRFERDKPDLVILDVMMPLVDGFEVCRKIRAVDPRVPILMLSAKHDIVDKSVGFAAGCDEYISKPFDPRELAMRVEANMRRLRVSGCYSEHEERPSSIGIGELEVRVDRGEAFVSGRPANLTPKEFRIIAFLALHPGKVFTAQSIIENVWPDDAGVEPSALAVFIRKIRNKIERDPSHPELLRTVWREGYRLGPSSDN